MKIEYPKISVVIPTFKRYEEAVRCIKSCLAQTIPVYEIIVSSDGDDAEKAKIVSKIGDLRVIYTAAKRTGSAGATRNHGISIATGDWIALLDDDDLWTEDKLEVFCRVINNHLKKPFIVAGCEKVFEKSGRSWERPKTKKETGKFLEPSEVLFGLGRGLNTSTLMAPASIFKQIKFNEEINLLEDSQWLIDAAYYKNVKIYIVPEVVCVRYKLDSGLSSSGDFNKALVWYKNNSFKMGRTARADFLAYALNRRAAFENRLRYLPWLFYQTYKLDRTGFFNRMIFMVAGWVLRRKKLKT